MLASGRLSASTVPAYCGSINRPESHRQPCPAAPAVLVSPSPTPIPRRKGTGGHLDPTSSNLTPRPNPHRARGADGAHSPAISCLGAFPTPPARAREGLATAGVRKPAHEQKCSALRWRGLRASVQNLSRQRVIITRCATTF